MFDKKIDELNENKKVLEELSLKTIILNDTLGDLKVVKEGLGLGLGLGFRV